LSHTSSRQEDNSIPFSRLYVSDLDGTLLGKDAALSAATRKKLTAMLQEGLPFTVASARSVVSMQQLLSNIPIRLPVIELNGAFVSDLKTGKHRVVHALESDIVTAIYGLCRQIDLELFLSTFNGSEDRLYYTEVSNDGMNWYVRDRTTRKDKRLRQTSRLTDHFTEHVVCMTVIDRIEALRPLQESIQRAFGERTQIHFFENPYSPGWYWLTVHDRKANKAEAIRTLVEMNGLGLEQIQLTVFGDNDNDMNMFQLATHAIAVGNATADLKRLATQVIGSHETDSVVHYLEQYGV
jgi:5-amino-6-(5-phospho-D-ribitylamino)uracil phosphatase